MLLEGKYAKAEVFTDNVEESAISQIINLCNQEFVFGSKISIMPDVHAGAGCTVGTTMTIKDKIVPNLVGVDISCGMETVKIKEKNLNFEKLDRIIHNEIPAGKSIRNNPHKAYSDIALEDLKFIHKIKKPGRILSRAKLSVATLGGGNHFIELNKDENDNIYIVIHSGSRNIGLQTANYYQKLAIDTLEKSGENFQKDLAYLEGQDMQDYLHDMKIMQTFAKVNRKAMMDIIVEAMGFTVLEQFTTIHNYIDLDHMILRKGAVSAQNGEKILIPLNMRDGSLLCIGKANPDWNYSAPHGAGRTMSRTVAKKALNMKEYEACMKGIYTSTVNIKTLDEAPMAYKTKSHILERLDETCELISRLKPIYNFKSSD